MDAGLLLACSRISQRGAVESESGSLGRMGGVSGALCSGARMYGFSSSYRVIVHRPMGLGDCDPTVNWRVAACLGKTGRHAEELKKGGRAGKVLRGSVRVGANGSQGGVYRADRPRGSPLHRAKAGALWVRIRLGWGWKLHVQAVVEAELQACLCTW